MRLDGRRESNNFEDRRGMSGGTKAGMGIGGIILVGIITLLMGGNMGDVINNVGQQMSQVQEATPEGAAREFSEAEQEQAKFCRQVLASTEDVWTAVFQKMGRTYQPPTLVLFSGSVQSACGGATAAVGPFYCSGDQKLYIDLSFFTQMEKQLGAPGDFARAYVIAHEVGHHVQNLLGTAKARQKPTRPACVWSFWPTIMLECGPTTKTKPLVRSSRATFKRPSNVPTRLATTTCRKPSRDM